MIRYEPLDASGGGIEIIYGKDTDGDPNYNTDNDTSNEDGIELFISSSGIVGSTKCHNCNARGGAFSVHSSILTKLLTLLACSLALTRTLGRSPL